MTYSIHIKPVPEDNPSLLALIFPKEPQALMAFSTRRGGFSPAPFDSLNFSAGEGDDPGNVDANTQALCDVSGINLDGLAACRQVHGDNIAVVESTPFKPVEADALITSQVGVFPSVKIADCLPILVIDPIRKAAAAIHAGRTSTALRISAKVVRKLSDAFGSRPDDLVAVLGPSIRACCYELDESAVEPFRKALPWADSCVLTLESFNAEERSHGIDASNLLRLPSEMVSAPAPVKPTRPAALSLRVDLALANYFELLNEGVEKKNIFIVDHCTACHPDLFYSHRRDRGRTGRHIALVGFKEDV